MMIKKTDIIGYIPRLKPLPYVAMQVIRAVNDPDMNIDEVVEIVHMDQVMTAKVLRIINSVIFGLKREVKSLKEALMYLGTNRLVPLVLMAMPSSAIMDNLDGYKLKKGELWEHSASTAIATQILGKHVKYPDLNVLFTLNPRWGNFV